MFLIAVAFTALAALMFCFTLAALCPVNPPSIPFVLSLPERPTLTAAAECLVSVARTAQGLCLSLSVPPSVSASSLLLCFCRSWGWL